MTNIDQQRLLEQLLADAHPPEAMRFDSGFADRVVKRVVAGGAPQDSEVALLQSALTRQTRRLLPALLAASLALTAWNWWTDRNSAESTFAAALGLQPVTLAAAVGSGVLLGAEAYQ